MFFFLINKLFDGKFRLKEFLGLAMPNQYFLTVRKQILGWLWINIWGKKPLTFMIPIYSTAVLYDTHT